MAPLHHHFELKGVVEPKIVVRLWIVGIIFLMFALSTLKIR
jgi:phospho-N-acetylmuramoyl-pentapeptide-transferase